MTGKMLAFIGTREPTVVSEEIRTLYDQAAAAAVWSGYTVVTGAAVGFDQIAAASALQAGGLVLLVLPWHSYEQRWWSYKIKAYPGKVHTLVYNPSTHQSWTDSVYRYHSAPAKLTRGAFALQARNFGIIASASSVIAVPNPTKTWGGGTGQGIKIARDQGKRVFDLTHPEDFNVLERRISVYKDSF